jgi:hypothetical protein
MTEKKAHPLDRAWAAGFFQARGRFPKTAYTLRIEGTEKEAIERFKDVVGVGKITVSDRVSKTEHNMALPNLVWQAPSMDDSRTALLSIAPFLTGIKKAHAAELIAKIERNPIWQKKHPTKVSSSVTSRAQAVEAKTTEQNTPVDGSDASDAEPTGK